MVDWLLFSILLISISILFLISLKYWQCTNRCSASSMANINTYLNRGVWLHHSCTDSSRFSIW